MWRGARQRGTSAAWLACAGDRRARERVRVPEEADRFPRIAREPGWFTTRVERFEEAAIPSCDLFNSSFSLPFVDPSRFEEVWARIVGAVRPGGRFAGQLFGDRDTWAALPDRSHQTRGRVEELLAPFEVEHFQEEERDGGDCMNTPKHWHVFHIVARKRG